MTFGHTRSRYFPPANGGLIPLGGISGSVFRIDHDQAYTYSMRSCFRPKSSGTELADGFADRFYFPGKPLGRSRLIAC